MPATQALPFAGIHTPAGPARVQLGLTITAIILSVAATITLGSGASAIRAGEMNATPPFIFAAADVAWLATWVLCIGTLVTVCARAHGNIRWLAAGGLIAVLTATPVSCAHRRYPDDAYLTGFSTWTRTHVNVSAVRQWQASLSPTATPLTIPPAQYPPAISTLSPDIVEQYPTGITLQWGRQATWSSSRKVFVGAADASAPPVDPFHAWQQVLPGLYAARGASD